MRLRLQLTSILAVFLMASSAFAGPLSKFEKGGIPKISPPNVRVQVLKNGIRCFLLEDHTLPMVQINVISRTGGIYEPADKLGLAELTGMTMRSGGAGGLSPEVFDESVDNLAATLTSGLELEMGESYLKVLSPDLEKGAKLLFDMIFKPGFDAKRMEINKLKIEEGLRRENDDPDSVASRHLRQLVYGELSPWARRPSKGTLNKITMDDMRSFHKKYFRTDNLIIAAAGDFNSDELIALINRLTKDAPRGKVDFPDVAQIKPEFSPQTDQITRPLTQSFIRMGHLGIKRNNPDKFALILLNDILGASNFKSRLMEDIRTKRGMAYSIWSQMSVGTDYGLFAVGVDTKARQAGEVIDLVREHIKDLTGSKAVSSQELEFARQSVLAGLIFEFDNSFKVVDRRANFFFYNYPENYWQIFRDKIIKVKINDISDVARRYLHPDALKIVVVGPQIEELN